MENTCLSTRERQFKGCRMKIQYGLWMWCIVIQCLMNLPCIFSSCQGVNISVSIHPENMIYVPYGEPLEMFCIAENNYTADNLEFVLGGNHVVSQIVNTTTRRLYIEHLERQVLLFYCKNKVTNKVCANRVLVDSTPFNVTDFSCISRNIEELNCTWSPRNGLSTTNYSLAFLMLNNKVSLPCTSHIVGKKHLCNWTDTSRPRYKQMEEHFNFLLTACNVFGCNNQTFMINHHAIVKPDKVMSLKVVSLEPHSVLLSWNIPNNIVDFLTCPIVHRIEYQIAKIDRTDYFRSVDTSILKSNSTYMSKQNKKSYKFLLSNLPYAHMKYEVRIYIKPESATEERFWSDFAYELFTTSSERPKRPPDTVVGAFDQSIYNDKRVIYVYWKQLEEYEEAGANFTYKVVVLQGSKNPQTILSDKNKSLSYVILNDASLEAIDVTIWSTNAVGSSVNSSHLYIPPIRDTDALQVQSFTKLAYQNGTHKLSWIGAENLDNYTLFWCQHNTTKICAGRMNFTVLEPDKSTHIIDLPKENRYQFAISANRGFKTSGMIWASCDISKDGIPMYGFPVQVNHDAPGKTHVKITWTMSCTLQEGIITGYNISYCPVVNTSSICDPAFGNKSTYYIDNPKQMEINITNLKPYRTYQFALALNTTYGLKTIENASTGVTTTEDTPTSPQNITLSDIQYDSIIVSWDPPVPKNGIIGKYVIFDSEQEIYVEKVPVTDKDIDRRTVTVTGLKPFTNYSISVQACNTAIRSCSKKSEAIFVRTRIGPPGTLKPPIIKTNSGLLKWEPPTLKGGTVDRYEIQKIKDDNLETTEFYNTTNLSYSLIYCGGMDLSESYQVRAVNIDVEQYHGVLADRDEVEMPKGHNKSIEYPGEWSSPSTLTCRNRDGITMGLILVAVFVFIGIMYASIKCFKIVRKMEDIDPVLPSGLGIPEKDISKYAYGGLYSTNKDDKPSSDEMLLLPNSRTTVSTPENKQNTDNNCGSSDHTDSTTLSDSSRGPIERHASTSDDGSDSSLHLEVEPVRSDNIVIDEESSNSETDNSKGNSPSFSDKVFKKNLSGYVQSVVNTGSGYVQSTPAPHKSPSTKPTSSSYVMAALSPSIFTTNVVSPNIQIPPSSGYVRPEDAAQARSMMNLPKLGPSPTKGFATESLPTMPNLPQPVKHGADSSYIQLQSLDALTSHKQPVRNTVPLKPVPSSGYVSPGDAVINKHLNNMLSGGQLAEDSVVLDPTMSPDAYCRFSWSADPTNDNLHSLLANSHTMKTSKN